MNSKSRLLAILAFQLLLIPSAYAQDEDKDPFGEVDDTYADIEEPADPNALTGPYVPPQIEENPQAQAPSADTSMAAQSLFGLGGGAAAIPKPNPRWGNINSNAGGERIEDTYEMRMKEELGKPLPKRNPFGDQMNEIDTRFKSNKPKL